MIPIPIDFPRLWRAAEEGWCDVMVAADSETTEALSARWLRRLDYEVVAPLLRGLEAFVRRVLLMAALALDLPALKARARRTRSGPKPAEADRDPRITPVTFRVFPLARRARGRRPRLRYEAAEKPAEELWIPPRLLRGPEPRRPRTPRPRSGIEMLVLRGDPPPLKHRAAVMPALGIAMRLEAIRRVLAGTDRFALRLRRRLDREKLRRAGLNAPQPSLLPPWPRDHRPGRKGRPLFMHDTMHSLYPGIDIAILREIDSS